MSGGISRGRELYTTPHAMLCPVCHCAMACKMDIGLPTLYIVATCWTENCKLCSVRHMVKLQMVDGREMESYE